MNTGFMGFQVTPLVKALSADVTLVTSLLVVNTVQVVEHLTGSEKTNHESQAKSTKMELLLLKCLLAFDAGYGTRSIGVDLLLVFPKLGDLVEMITAGLATELHLSAVIFSRSMRLEVTVE